MNFMQKLEEKVNQAELLKDTHALKSLFDFISSQIESLERKKERYNIKPCTINKEISELDELIYRIVLKKGRIHQLKNKKK